MISLHAKLLGTIFLLAGMLMSFVEPSMLTFDKMDHNFGQIAQGIPQVATFELTNNSEEALILTKVKGSCGCTATSYAKEPVAPGTTTLIEATYNAKNLGQFSKTVSVYTNLQEEPLVLTIRGKVVK